ncbi:MAG: holo-[acyl-carrier-protein] synthase [Armatimonadia bacterium]|nr:holo-[acyl-carrier-protein] synthase [Armatimonadia bacterium]
MIRGVGVDIVEIERVERALTRRPSLLTRLFTPEEVRYCEARPGSRYAHFAGRFAAKEAVAKALGRSLGWREVAVMNNELGKPTAVLSGRAVEAVAGGTIMLSISHSRDYAVAQAVFWTGEVDHDEQEGPP